MQNHFDIIFDKIIESIEKEYIDVSFFDQHWQGIKEKYHNEILTIQSESQFIKVMKEFFATLPLSHCAFISLQEKKEIEQIQYRAGGNKILELATVSGEKYFYIKIPTLSPPHCTSSKITHILNQIKPSQTIILDLRLNTGGSPSLVGQLLGAFLAAEKPYLYSRKRNWSTEEPVKLYPYELENLNDLEAEIAQLTHHQNIIYYTDKKIPNKINNPIIILIGKRTYSCGEVFPQCMKENKRAVLVGEKTSGSVVAGRDDYDLGAEYYIMLPFAWLITHKGTNLEGVGVLPDLERQFIESDSELLTNDTLDELMAMLALVGVAKQRS